MLCSNTTHCIFPVALNARESRASLRRRARHMGIFGILILLIHLSRATAYQARRCATHCQYMLEILMMLSPMLYLRYHAINKVPAPMISSGWHSPAFVMMADTRCLFRCLLMIELDTALRSANIEHTAEN